MTNRPVLIIINHYHAGHLDLAHLDVSVDEVVELEVVVVLPEGIDERLRHFEPTDEEDELENEEERRVEVERLKRGNLIMLEIINTDTMIRN